MTVETVKADVAAYLAGEISLQQLTVRNDRVIDTLMDEHKGGPVWALSADVEGLICEHVYQHCDEATFRARIGALL